MIYFDNSATTAPSDACVQTMMQTMKDDFANASSVHSAGVAAHKWIDLCKKAIADSLGCLAAEILLTPGGTYSNNLAMMTAVNMLRRRGNKIVISNVEHPSVSECAKKLAESGFEVVECDPRDMTNFENVIDSKTILVSCMLVNNETGTVFEVEKLRDIITKKSSPALLHIDAVQAFGKLAVKVKKLRCDMLTLSAHKINGPKGIGALYASKKIRISPIVYGGEQENGFIPGTYNTPAIAGFYTAVTDLKTHDTQKYKQLYDKFVSRVSELDFIKINDYGKQAHHIINITFEGYLGENVVHYLEGFEVYVSQGSACSSHSKQKGRVLTAFGADRKTADGSVRVSFDINNTPEQIERFFEICADIPQKLIKLYR